MRMYDIIEKKKHGNALSKEEIEFFVNGFTKGEIPDYQAAALLMAIYFSKMNMRETVDLTMAMVNSGDKLDLSAINGKTADKHSTGGVGDKTTLIVAPIVASLGVCVAKMSGRGLGHTGGTIDKLESFPGFNTSLDEKDFIKNVTEERIAVIGQTADLAPADKVLYALRDVTATIDNISLIASSIMSKKLAAGCQVIVLDVKVGSGAFMKTKEQAEKLAKVMVAIGTALGRDTYAVISDMSQPLGVNVGNIMEVTEAIEVLNGKCEEDLYEACESLATYMLIGAGITDTPENASKLIKQNIENGKALEKLKTLVRLQGGDDSYVDHPDKFEKAKHSRNVCADKAGYVESIDADQVGLACMEIGGGRETKASVLDLSVGLNIYKKVGDKIEVGDVLAAINYNDDKKAESAVNRLRSAYHISDKKVEKHAHVLGVITKDDVNIASEDLL